MSRDEATGAERTKTKEEAAGTERRKWRYPPRCEHPDVEVYVYDKWCKACGICYELCPGGVLESDKSGCPVVAHPEKCIACHVCEMLCPDMAITVYKERVKKGAATKDEAADEAGKGGKAE
jgi:2-oxoglutarate ferredoxin oxidoreductase subunit delta